MFFRNIHDIFVLSYLTKTKVAMKIEVDVTCTHRIVLNADETTTDEEILEKIKEASLDINMNELSLWITKVVVDEDEDSEKSKDLNNELVDKQAY